MWARVVRVLGRAWYWTRFQLFQRHRFDRLVLESVAGRPFVVLPEVFNPALFWTSEFMVRAFDAALIPPGSRVLDMGTGSGVGAVFVSRWASGVTAVDVNPAAVRCARINVLLNGVEDRVEVRESALFAALEGETFDVIIFNPPYFRGEPSRDLDRAFRASRVIDDFAERLHDHLSDAGHALVVLSSAGDEAPCLDLFRQAGYRVDVVARRELWSETLTLYKVHRAMVPAG